MTRDIEYRPEETLVTARARYFAANGFGADGGYQAPFVDFKLGPIPFPFPNTDGRRRAVRYHDLHHIVTGYATDFTGELEIAAWELGGGCWNFPAAWLLNLGGTAMGAAIAPRKTFRAFARGRRSRTLYGQPLEPLLSSTVGEARQHCRVDQRTAPRLSDVPLFAAAWLGGSIFGWLFLLGVTALLPIGLAMSLRWRRLADHGQ